MKAKFNIADIEKAKGNIYLAVRAMIEDGKSEINLSIEFRKKDQAVSLEAMNQLINQKEFKEIQTIGRKKYFRYIGNKAA